VKTVVLTGAGAGVLAELAPPLVTSGVCPFGREEPTVTVYVRLVEAPGATLTGLE
jgi:hypothetical protein